MSPLVAIAIGWGAYLLGYWTHWMLSAVRSNKAWGYLLEVTNQRRTKRSDFLKALCMMDKRTPDPESVAVLDFSEGDLNARH